MLNKLKSKKLRALSVVLIGLLSSSNAFAAAGSNLKSDDFVGVSFWMISMALVAATAFFFLETQRVTAKWKTSLTVSGLVTMVAAWHYFYMRDVWVATGATPTGKNRAKQVPCPGRESTTMVPPCACTTPCTTGKPRPVPTPPPR